MDRRGSRWIVTVALLVFAALALADQGGPVYQANGTKPTQGGACNSERVQIEYDTGKIWCCVSNLWAACGSVTTATTATQLSVNPTACTANQYVRDMDANGTLTCAQPAYSALTGLPTLAPTGAQYIVAALDGTLTADRAATGTSTITVDTGTASQIKWNLSTSIPQATTFYGSTSDVSLTTDLAADAGNLNRPSPKLKLVGNNWSGSASVPGTWQIWNNLSTTDRLAFDYEGVEKLSIDTTGAGVFASDVQTQRYFVGPTTGSAQYRSWAANGAGNVGHKFGSTVTNWSAPTKIAAFYNDPNTTEVASIDAAGKITAAGGFSGALNPNDLSGPVPLAKIVDEDAYPGNGRVLVNGGAAGDPSWGTIPLAALPDDDVAPEDTRVLVNGGGGAMVPKWSNNYTRGFPPAATLASCLSDNSGVIQIKRVASSPDQAFICLQNADGTWNWAMIGVAIK